MKTQFKTVLFLLFSFAFLNGAMAKGGKTYGYSIKDYGAVSDGKTLCSDAINKAIDAAVKAGGGTVFFPAGEWLTGTIFLKSNVTLHLESGCVIRGSKKTSDYPVMLSPVESHVNTYTKRSLICAINQENIAIEGNGIIDGNGGSYPMKAGGENDFIRPYLMRIIQCRNVRINDIQMRNSAMWNQHYLACENVRINNIKVFDFCNYNNDAMDVDGCKDVIISNSSVYSLDDGITLKSSSLIPCEDIVITNCISASRSSGIKMGTETNGGFKNINISNCSVFPVPAEYPRPVHKGREGLTAIELIIVDGGHMENVNVNNITVKGYIVPVGLMLGARGRHILKPKDSNAPKRLPVGSIKNVSFSNIIATGATSNCGILLSGIEGHNLENISLSNILIQNAGGEKAELADKVEKEHTYDYPQASFWGKLPCYGLFARHIRGLNVNNVRLLTDQADGRHAVVLDDVHEAYVNGLSCRPAASDKALVKLAGVKDVLIQGCQPVSAEGAFLQITGDKSENIAITGNNLLKVKSVVEKTADVPEGEIHLGANIEK